MAVWSPIGSAPGVDCNQCGRAVRPDHVTYCAACRADWPESKGALCPDCAQRPCNHSSTGRHQPVNMEISMAYGDQVQVGDRVRVWMGPSGTSELTGIVTELRGNLVVVRDDRGNTDAHDKSEVSKMSALSTMATAADLNVGDKVRNTRTGETGEITDKRPDGSARVEWSGAGGGGYFHPGAPLPPEIQKMSNDAPVRAFDAVDLARSARCSYCTKTVAMSQRTLGQHNAPGGPCAGSGRRVAEFDYLNRPIFEPMTFGARVRIEDLQIGEHVTWHSALASGRGKVIRLMPNGPEGAAAMLDTGDGVTNADHVERV